MKIQINGCIIDFYVNKKKYESLKTRRGKYNLVYRELKTILDNLKDENNKDIQVRLASITSNNFWGQDHLNEINELGWRGEESIPKNEKNVTIRVFQIDIISVITSNREEGDFPLGFLKLKGKGYLIESGSCKII